MLALVLVLVLELELMLGLVLLLLGLVLALMLGCFVGGQGRHRLRPMHAPMTSTVGGGGRRVGLGSSS